MNPAVFMLVTAVFGVDYGWQVNREGKLEYIIQISPESFRNLPNNPDGITSLIPPDVQGVRVIRIRVGTGNLPRDPIPGQGAGGGLGAATQWNPNAENGFNSGAPRVNLAAQNFGAGDGLLFDSNVTPLDSNGATQNMPQGTLPGPIENGVENPQNDVNELINSTIPRSTPIAVREFGGSGAVPRAEINRNTLDRIQPNTRAPDSSFAPNTNNDPNHPYYAGSPYQQPQAGQYNDFFNKPPVGAAPYDQRTSVPGWGQQPPAGNPNYYTNGANYGSGNVNYRLPAFTGTQQAVMLFLLLLCLSIGVNVFLGWVAWDYYLRYRDALDQWRSSNYTPST